MDEAKVAAPGEVLLLGESEAGAKTRKEEEAAARVQERSGMHIDRRALFCLEELCKKSALKTLILRGEPVGPWGASFISRGCGVHNAGLETLTLDDCRLRDEGIEMIAKMLGKRGVTIFELSLCGNGIGADGLGRLAEGLRENTNLVSLSLARNRITDKKIPLFAQAFGCHESLQVLDLGSNAISFTGAMHICSGLRTSDTLLKLLLPHNKLRIDALWRLASIGIGHDALTLLDLRGIRLGVKDWRKAQDKTKFTRLQFKLDAPLKRRHKPSMPAIGADDESGKHGPVVEEVEADLTYYQPPPSRTLADDGSVQRRVAPAAAPIAEEDDGPVIELNEEDSQQPADSTPNGTGAAGKVDDGSASAAPTASAPAFSPGDVVYYLGVGEVWEDGDRLEFGARGEVTGPSDDVEDSVEVRFVGNKDVVDCLFTDLSRTPPPRSSGEVAQMDGLPSWYAEMLATESAQLRAGERSDAAAAESSAKSAKRTGARDERYSSTGQAWLHEVPHLGLY